MKGSGDKNGKPSGESNPNHTDLPPQVTNSVAYAFVHPAHPITRIYYFPAIATFIITEVGLAFVPSPSDHLFTTTSLSSGSAGGDGFSSEAPGHGNGYNAISNNFYDFITYLPSFLLTSLFLYVLISNIAYGGVPDLENKYVSRSDDAAVITNRVGGGMLAGLSWLLSHGKNALGGLGGIGTGVVSQGVAGAVGGFEMMTNERILDNHSRDRSSRDANGEVTGYMRALDFYGDRGERLITRAMEAASWLFYRYADSALARRINLNDGNRAAFRAGIANGERFAIDLLVGYMNAMFFYLQRTADIYLISRFLQALRIADSSGSAIGTWRAFDPSVKSAAEQVGDKLENAGERIIHGIQHVGQGAGDVIHRMGEGFSGLFHHHQAQNTAAAPTYREASTQTDPAAGFPGILPWLHAFIFGAQQEERAGIHPPGYHHTFDFFQNLFRHHAVVIQPVEGNPNLFVLENGVQVQITEQAITMPSSGLRINLADNSVDLPSGMHIGPVSSESMRGLRSIQAGNDLVINGEQHSFEISQVNSSFHHQPSLLGRFASHDRNLGHITNPSDEQTSVSSFQEHSGGAITIVVGGLKITIRAVDNRKASAVDSTSTIGDSHHHDHDHHDHSDHGGGGLGALGALGDHHDA